MNRMREALQAMNAIGGEFHDDPHPEQVLGPGSDELCRRLGIDPREAKEASLEAALPYAIHFAQDGRITTDPRNGEEFRELLAMFAAAFLDGIYTAGFMDTVPQPTGGAHAD